MEPTAIGLFQQRLLLPLLLILILSGQLFVFAYIPWGKNDPEGKVKNAKVSLLIPSLFAFKNFTSAFNIDLISFSNAPVEIFV